MCPIKIAVLKNFTIFTAKHLCWSLFLIKLQALTLLKRNSNTDVFLRILQNYWITSFLQSSLGQLFLNIVLNTPLKATDNKNDSNLQNKSLEKVSFFAHCRKYRSSHWRCFWKKAVLKNFVNFTGKHLCWSHLSVTWGSKACNFIKKRLQHRCFPVKFAKLLRTLILKNICKRFLLEVDICKRNTLQIP